MFAWHDIIFALNIQMTIVFCKQELDHLFLRTKIVPELIPISPKYMCTVTYPNHGKLQLGERLDPDVTDNKPHVIWKANNQSLYTLYLAGYTWGVKDVIPLWKPTKYPYLRTHGAVLDWKQWVVVNIPGNRVSLGDTIFEYMPPGWPQKRTGLEHYVFLVCEQRYPIDIHSMREKRRHVIPTVSNTLDFIIEYDLRYPIAGNYFWTQRIRNTKATISTKWTII